MPCEMGTFYALFAQKHGKKTRSFVFFVESDKKCKKIKKRC